MKGITLGSAIVPAFIIGVIIGVIIGGLVYLASKRRIVELFSPKIQQWLGCLGLFGGAIGGGLSFGYIHGRFDLFRSVAGFQYDYDIFNADGKSSKVTSCW